MEKRRAGKQDHSKLIRFPDEWETTTPKERNYRKRVRFAKVPDENNLVSTEITQRTNLNKSTCECLKNKEGQSLFNFRSKSISGCIKKRFGDESVCAANFCCPELYLTSDKINSLVPEKVSRSKGKSVTGRYIKNDTKEYYYTHVSGAFVLCRNNRKQWQVSIV